MLTLHPGLDLTQPLLAFLQGLNWDNRPLTQALLDPDLEQESSGQCPFTQSVGQFFASFDWSGTRPRPEPVPEPPVEDPFTLEDFAALFGGALL
ncbi:MAG: hypothetical protein Q6L60_10835 [Thermostichus sp. HHBFW_bins_43]